MWQIGYFSFARNLSVQSPRPHARLTRERAIPRLNYSYFFIEPSLITCVGAAEGRIMEQSIDNPLSTGRLPPQPPASPKPLTFPPRGRGKLLFLFASVALLSTVAGLGAMYADKIRDSGSSSAPPAPLQSGGADEPDVPPPGSRVRRRHPTQPGLAKTGCAQRVGGVGVGMDGG